MAIVILDANKKIVLKIGKTKNNIIETNNEALCSVKATEAIKKYLFNSIELFKIILSII